MSFDLVSVSRAAEEREKEDLVMRRFSAAVRRAVESAIGYRTRDGSIAVSTWVDLSDLRRYVRVEIAESSRTETVSAYQWEPDAKDKLLDAIQERFGGAPLP